LSRDFGKGSVAGYGLRRELIDRHLAPKDCLAEESETACRRTGVILVPGLLEEIEVVQKIYILFTKFAFSSLLGF
jgi:hypothetical protein